MQEDIIGLVNNVIVTVDDNSNREKDHHYNVPALEQNSHQKVPNCMKKCPVFFVLAQFYLLNNVLRLFQFLMLNVLFRKLQCIKIKLFTSYYCNFSIPN